MESKITVAIVKSGQWQYAHLSKNHPEYSAIFSLMDKYRFRIRFVLLGSCKCRTEGFWFENDTVAWDIQEEGVFGNVAYYLHLLRFVMQYKPQIIIVLGLHSVLPVALYSLMNPKAKYIPVFIGEFGYHESKRGRVMGKLLFIAGLQALGVALRLSQKRIVSAYALSNYVKENLQKLTPRLHWEGAQRMELVSYPISENFSPQEGLSPKQTGEPVILTVAAIEPRKGLDVLIEAIHIISKERFLPIKVRIKGPIRDASYMRLLDKMIDDYGLRDRVSFLTEHVDYDELAAYYSNATIFVFPTREDSLGVVVLEALYCGKPVIATAVGGIPDMIKDGKNGILVQPENPEELAEAIVALLDDETLRNRLAANAKLTLITDYYKNRLTLKEALTESMESALGY